MQAIEVSGLQRDILFVGLTRPQTFGGVTYGVVILNVVATTELFLVFKSPLVLLLAGLFHVVGWLACLRDARIFDIWLIKISRCPRVRAWSVWRCNSYRA